MEVTIKQIGGHTGSLAGDFAIVTLKEGDNTTVVVIDTGSITKLWKDKNLEHFREYLNGQNAEEYILITTHFHDDHYSPENLKALGVENFSLHVFPKEACKNWWGEKGWKYPETCLCAAKCKEGQLKKKNAEAKSIITNLKFLAFH